MTVLDTQRPKVMTVVEADEIKDRACGHRRRYGRSDAQLIAARRNQARPPGSTPFNAYRCPFSGAHHHWHVARLITVAGMSDLAQAIRVLGQST